MASLIVYVKHIGSDWIAECDALHLVTEAKSYDGLTARVWQIAPELFELNGLQGEAKDMLLSFVHEESFAQAMAL